MSLSYRVVLVKVSTSSRDGPTLLSEKCTFTTASGLAFQRHHHLPWYRRGWLVSLLNMATPTCRFWGSNHPILCSCHRWCSQSRSHDPTFRIPLHPQLLSTTPHLNLNLDYSSSPSSSYYGLLHYLILHNLMPLKAQTFPLSNKSERICNLKPAKQSKLKMVPRSSLSTFLRSAKSHLKAAINGTNHVTFVVGNESAGILNLSIPLSDE